MHASVLFYKQKMSSARSAYANKLILMNKALQKLVSNNTSTKTVNILYCWQGKILYGEKILLHLYQNYKCMKVTMETKAHITEHIYWLGVNDRKTRFFENLWPLDRGISYNSYLINDEKTALIDTVEAGTLDDFEEKLAAAIGDKKLDYLIVNHIEPDHSGGISAIMEKYPEVTIVGNKKTVPMLKGYFNVPDAQIKVIDDKESLSLGKHTLQFYLTSLVHWPETMMTYVPEEKLLFSGDAFGTFGALEGDVLDKDVDFEAYRDEARRYYSNIVGKYAKPVQKALKKLADLDIKTIASTHGPVWQKHIPDMLELYQQWSKFEAEKGVVIAFGSMYGNTEKVADEIARRLKAHGVEQVKIHDVSKTHASYIISDIFKYRGVIFGTPTYNGNMFPLVEYLIMHLNMIKVKDRVMSVFGSQSWSGGGVKKVAMEAENLKWELVGDPVEAFCAPDNETMQGAEAIAKAMAEKL